MRIVLDTNVFLSGVFFSGPPTQILKRWRDGLDQISVSPEILEEYRKVGRILSKRFSIDIAPWLTLVAAKAIVVDPPQLREQICKHSDDDKFIACAIASQSKVIISGDHELLKASGYEGIEILKPRQYLERVLERD